jgi:hypothetical protein
LCPLADISIETSPKKEQRRGQKHSRRPGDGGAGEKAGAAGGTKAGRLVCASCDRVFNAASSLKYHMDAEHGTARFFCTFEGCDKVNSREIALGVTVINHHRHLSHKF